MRGELGSDLDKSTGDLSPSTENELTKITFDKLVLGDQYDVLDASHRWCEGEVQKLDRKTGSVFVTYVYWDSQFDEWISDRFAPLHTHTYIENGQLKKGQRIEVLDERKEWLEAFVVEDEDGKGNISVKVHYKGFHTKFDEWILRSNAATRVRPYGRHKNIAHKSIQPPTGRPRGQKQWRVPGSNSARRPLSAGADASTSGCSIPGRQNRDNKEYSRVKMPGGELPRINATSMDTLNAENAKENHVFPRNNNDEERHGDARTRRITNLSPEYVQYLDALARRNLQVVSVEGDGNCLFRAVAHQIYGNEELHNIVRQKCVDYMESEAEFFSQFVEGGKDMFPLYLRAKRLDACWGDDPEIEAICELYDRRAEIWAFDATLGARKLRTFHETSLAGFQRDHSGGSASSSGSAQFGRLPTEPPVIRLSYYGGGHYDSIVCPSHAAQVLHKTPGELEDAHIMRTKERRLSRAHSNTLPPIYTDSSPEGLAEAQRVSDQEATERATLDQVIRQSRDAYVRTEYDDLETCLLLSLQQHAHSSYQGRGGPVLKEDPADSTSLAPAGATNSNNDLADPEAEAALLRTIQEQSERDYYENALISSLAAEGKVDDSALTEAALLDLVKQESERDARQEYESTISATNNVEALTHNASQNARMSQTAMDLARLSEEEALELAMLASLTNNNHQSHCGASSSRSENSHAGVPVAPTSTSSNMPSQDMHQFHTEEELLQLALQASMQGYAVPSATWTDHNSANAAGSRVAASSSTARATPGGGYAINIGAPYVNINNNSDYSEDMDEELMRAIEASLRK